MPVPDTNARLRRERDHGEIILRTDESNWGWGSVAGAIRRQRRADFLCAPVAAQPKPRVLEVGCGTGTFTGDLAAAFPGLLAMDVSEVLLATARRKLAASGAMLVMGDAHNTGLASGCFDLVLGCSVLHHLDWERALREFHRLLAPGGEVRFSEPNLANPQIFFQKNWRWLKTRMGDSPDEYAFTVGQISRALEAAGFVELRVRPYEFLHPSTPGPLIPLVIGLERWLEATPLRAIAGSLEIRARKPGVRPETA